MDLFEAEFVDQGVEGFDRATEVGDTDIEEFDLLFHLRDPLRVGDGLSQAVTWFMHRHAAAISEPRRPEIARWQCARVRSP